MAPFHGFNYLKAAEPLQGDCLLLTPGVPGTHLLNLGRMSGFQG